MRLIHMNRPHEIWRSLAPRPDKRSLGSRPAQRKRKQLLVLLKTLKEDHPNIYAGIAGVTLSKVEAERFCEKLRIDTPGHVYKQRRNLFVLGLEKGVKQLGWDLYIPAPVSSYRRETPYFTRNTMFSLSRLREIEKCVIESLDNPIPENKSISLGYLIFTATVYGGLINRDWLIAWTRNPFDGLVYDEPIAWIELYRSITGKKGRSSDQVQALHKRWFVDPLTLLLLGRLHDQIIRANYERSDPWTHLRTLMDHLDIPDHIRPKSLAEFLRIAHIRVALHSKPYLADYGAGKLKSASLPPEIWARIRTGKPVPIPDQLPDTEAETIPSLQKKLRPKSFHGSMTPALWRNLYEAIFPKESRQKEKRTSSGQSKANLNRFLDIYGDQLSPLAWLIAQWAISLLTYKRGIRKGSKIAASSVHSYVTTIAKPLHIHVADNDLRGFSEAEFYELYRDVIEQKTSEANKQTTALRLVEFHEFLVTYWDVEPVDLSEFYRGHYKSELGVDANLICPSMYKGAVQALGGLRANQPREQLMLVLMTMLGQKCGLRRAEIITLLRSDIIGNYDPVLFLRHNPYAYKKSDNAIRQIPLKAFLTHKELSLLKSWLHIRDTEDRSMSLSQRSEKKRLLFCRPGEPNAPVDEGMAFKAIHQAMRQVTGDPNVHFHILRHSFASWFLFRLETSADPLWRPRAVLALNARENSHRRSQAERARLRFDPRVNRKALFQLAQTCGHAGAEMSLRHYVHMLDLLLGLNCWKPASQPSLSKDAVINLTGIGQAMAYRYRQRSDQDEWLPSIFVPTAFMQLKHQFKDTLTKNLKSMDTSPVVIERKPIGWRTLQSILEARQTGKMRVPDIAGTYDVEEQFIEGVLEGARHLYKMRTRSTSKYPKGKPRHRLDSARLPFPIRPTSPYDITICDRIFDRYMRADLQKREVILAGVRRFIDSFSLSCGDIRFTDQNAAKGYLAFLSAIGIKQGEIWLIHYRGKEIGEAQASNQLQNWAKALSVPAGQCKLAKSPFGQSKGNGTIGVTIKSLTGRTGKGRKAKQPKFTMPYGFRYVLYLLFILTRESNG